jgi:cytochrome P450
MTQNPNQRRGPSVGGCYYKSPETFSEKALISIDGEDWKLKRAELFKVVFDQNGLVNDKLSKLYANTELLDRVEKWAKDPKVKGDAVEDCMPVCATVVFSILFDVFLTADECLKASKYRGSIAQVVLPVHWMHTFSKKSDSALQLLRKDFAAVLKRSPHFKTLTNAAQTVGAPLDAWLLEIIDPILFAGINGSATLLSHVLMALQGKNESYHIQYPPRTTQELAVLFRLNPAPFVLEVARVNGAVGGFATVLENPTEKTVCGRQTTLPRGCLLHGNIAMSSLDEAAWGASAKVFDPSRDHSMLLAWNGPRGPASTSAPRICPGMELSIKLVQLCAEKWLDHTAPA